MHDPSLLLKTYLEEEVIVKLRDGQLVAGILHGFDEHHNILLSGVIDHVDEAFFIRGDSIIFIGQK